MQILFQRFLTIIESTKAKRISNGEPGPLRKKNKTFDLKHNIIESFAKSVTAYTKRNMKTKEFKSECFDKASKGLDRRISGFCKTQYIQNRITNIRRNTKQSNNPSVPYCEIKLAVNVLPSEKIPRLITRSQVKISAKRIEKIVTIKSDLWILFVSANFSSSFNHAPILISY